MNTEKRMLRYNFTPEEHLANCDELARLFDTSGEMESNHKAIKTQLKEDEDEVAAKIGKHVRFVRDKYDHRPIECTWTLDSPLAGQKTLKRIDTDTEVEIRRMEDWEKQQTLNLQPEGDSVHPSDLPPSDEGEKQEVPEPSDDLPPTHSEKLAERRKETEKKKALRAEAGVVQ